MAPDWPGLERGATSPELALERLRAYLPRYRAVAERAGRAAEFADPFALRVVERYPGNGSTDFWGISFTFSSQDRQPLSGGDLERQLGLMRACWDFFDDVRRRVSAEMRKGPRGGGRDRDRIVRHVLGTEQDWARKLGLPAPRDLVVTDDEGVSSARSAYCARIEALQAECRMARGWPLRYLIRHTAYHTMDHAWEMEDKDLGGAAAE